MESEKEVAYVGDLHCSRTWTRTPSRGGSGKATVLQVTVCQQHKKIRRLAKDESNCGSQHIALTEGMQRYKELGKGTHPKCNVLNAAADVRTFKIFTDFEKEPHYAQQPFTKLLFRHTSVHTKRVVNVKWVFMIKQYKNCCVLIHSKTETNSQIHLTVNSSLIGFLPFLAYICDPQTPLELFSDVESISDSLRLAQMSANVLGRVCKPPCNDQIILLTT